MAGRGTIIGGEEAAHDPALKGRAGENRIELTRESGNWPAPFAMGGSDGRRDASSMRSKAKRRRFSPSSSGKDSKGLGYRARREAVCGVDRQKTPWMACSEKRTLVHPMMPFMMRLTDGWQEESA